MIAVRLILPAAILFVSFAAQADQIPSTWLQCKINSDCVKIFGCTDMAINKNYLAQWQATFKGCDASQKPNPDAVALCMTGHCVVAVPRTPPSSAPAPATKAPP
jgi:hypothetical protein